MKYRVIGKRLIAWLLVSVMYMGIWWNCLSAAEIAPIVGAWSYDANKCTNFSSPGTWAEDCRVLDGGIWAGSSASSNPFRCENPSHPRPWSSESMIEPLASARSGGSASLQGWQDEAETVHCTGVFDTAGQSETLGVESANVSLISINDSAGAWGARRGREITCPSGTWTLADRCLQHPVADPYRAFDMCPKNATNPVNAFTGAKVHSETDFRGVGPNPLVLTRYYSTRTEWRHAPWEASGFGVYWRHNYTRSITHFKNSTFESMTVYLGNGNRIYFKPELTNDETVWRASEPDISSSLEEISLEGEGFWELRTENGDRQRYQRPSGRLDHILHANGFKTSFSYDEQGLLSVIDNGFGRSLVFTYAEEGLGFGLIERVALHVNGVTVPNSERRYEYKNTNPAGYQVMLGKVIYPDENTKEYLYNESEHIYYEEKWTVDVTDGPSTRSANHPTKLTGVIDENDNRFATYKYQRTSLGGGYRYMLPVWGGHGVADENGRYANEYKINSYHLDSNRSDSRSHQGYASIEDALGTERQFHFKNTAGVMRPTQIIGGKCEVCGSDAQQTSYDQKGFVASEVDFAGNKIVFERDQSGLETCRIEGISTSDPTKHAPRRIVTEWQSDFRVILQKSIYEPDDSADIENCNPHDDAGWIIRHKTVRTYEPGSSRLSSQILRSFDSSGIEDELPRITSYDYYVDGEQWGLAHQLKRIDGPRTDVDDTTVYRYAVHHSATHNPGDLVETQNALGHVTKVEAHDEFGRPLKIIDPNGIATLLTYYARGWLKSRTVEGATTTYEYDGLGQLQKVILPSGGFITQEYDEAHRLTDIKDNFNSHIHYQLDPMGNRIAEEIRDASGQLRKRASQAINELNQSAKKISFVDDIESLVTGYIYGTDGNLIKIIDPRDPLINANDTLPDVPQIFSERTYDALNRTIGNRDRLGGITSYEYDVFDQVVAVKEPTDGDSGTPQGLSTRYTYNSFGDLKSLDSPDTGLTRYTYDQAGNMTLLERAQDSANGVNVRYEYDALNRLRLIDYLDDEQDVIYVYDGDEDQQYGIGRLTQIFDEGGETKRYYDGRGNTQNVITTRDGVVRTTEYHVDESNRLLRLKTPGGHRINYSYQTTGHNAGSNWIDKVELEQAGGTLVLANNISYLPFGPIRAWNYGNGVGAVNTYDLSYRIKNSQHAMVIDRTYRLDPASNVLQIDNNLNQLSVGQYQYDYLDRLTSAETESGTFSYQYDALGNRSSAIVNSVPNIYHYSASSHHLLEVDRIDSLAFQYDLNGNITSRDSITHTYGADNRLKAAVDGAGVHTYYLHNALGQRVKKAGEFKTIYYYDMQGRLLEETDVFGNTAKTYVYMEDKLLALIEADFNPFDDTDDDGMLDGFEKHYGFNVNNSADGNLDTDGDGYSNVTEHDAETNPIDLTDYPGSNDPGTVLQIPAMNKTIGIIAALIIMATVLPYVNSASLVIALVLLCSWAISESVSAKVHFVHTDHLGTPIALSDEAQQVTWRATYSPFGGASIESGSTVELNIRFPGQYYDTETGLHYNYYRDYDPQLGRYVQSDPIGLGGGINTYAYADNNPLASVDPHGLLSRSETRGGWNRRYGKRRGGGGYIHRGFLPGLGPEWHHNRNQYQLCPPLEPIMQCKAGADWFYEGRSPTHCGYKTYRGRTGSTNEGAQCVYDDVGKVVSNRLCAGTWDYFSPYDRNNEPFPNLDHFRRDVLPWIIYGN